MEECDLKIKKKKLTWKNKHGLVSVSKRVLNIIKMYVCDVHLLYASTGFE